VQHWLSVARVPGSVSCTPAWQVSVKGLRVGRRTNPEGIGRGECVAGSF
jgi:hypothetical protein